MAPSSRKKVMITVIYKKGDPTKPENYRLELICGFRRLSIQYNMMQFGDLSEIIISVSNTFVS